jgi:UDP-N-acetylmuramoyl-tripeptide--D-alanyl-D-alanine ligase
MKSVALFSWQELLSVTEGEPVCHHRPFEQTAIETDTRTFTAESFFLPLTGENFNGNQYIEQAYEAGATGAFVQSAYLEAHSDLKRFPNLIAVPDPLQSYLALAQLHRRRSTAKIVAITGSSGKTTTKEMLYTMLASVKGDAIQKSEKNFNNEVGVALTLLNLRTETEVLILEMGMRGLGQIEVLSHHAQPDIAIITNIGPAHIGLLGSLEAIGQAKCEIFSGMDTETGIGIINGDDPLLVEEAFQYWQGRMDSFSLHEVDEIHLSAEGTPMFQYEETRFTLGLPGTHNVMNALACIKACEALGYPLKKLANALAHFETGGGRWQKSAIEGFENLWIINDAYNANPTSVKVSLEAFMHIPCPGLKKIAIMGGMAELGQYSEQYHREIGEWLNTRDGLDALLVIGQEAKPLAKAVMSETIPTYTLEKNVDAIPLIQQFWSQDAIFFLKASRAFHLEDIPELLKMSGKNAHAIS